MVRLYQSLCLSVLALAVEAFTLHQLRASGVPVLGTAVTGCVLMQLVTSLFTAYHSDPCCCAINETPPVLLCDQ